MLNSDPFICMVDNVIIPLIQVDVDFNLVSIRFNSI